MNREMFAQKPSVQESTTVASNLKTFDSSFLPYQFNTYTFDYPEPWKVYASESDKVRLTKDEVLPEETFYTAIVTEKKTYMEVHETSDAYTADLLRMLGVTDIEDRQIGDKQVIRFTRKGMEDPTVNILGYVFLTSYVNKASIVFSLNSGEETPATEDIKALEDIVRTYKIMPETPAKATVALKGSEFLKHEADLYKIYGMSVEKISAAWDCAENQYVRLNPQEIKDAKAFSADPLKTITLACLNQSLDAARAYRTSLDAGTIALSGEMFTIDEDERSYAFTLVEVWRNILATVDSKRIEQLKADIAAMSTSTDSQASFTKMKDTYYMRALELGEITYPFLERRQGVYSKIASSDAVEASPETLRKKYEDEAVKSTLMNLRAVAEVSYDALNSYDGVCGTNGQVQDKTMFLGLQNAKIYSGTSGCFSQGNPATAWAIYAGLSSDRTKFWCVDYMGTSKLIDGELSVASCGK